MLAPCSALGTPRFDFVYFSGLVLNVLFHCVGSEYGYERAEASQNPPKERLPHCDIHSINQQPLHRGGRSNPNQ